MVLVCKAMFTLFSFAVLRNSFNYCFPNRCLTRPRFFNYSVKMVKDIVIPALVLKLLAIFIMLVLLRHLLLLLFLFFSFFHPRLNICNLCESNKVLNIISFQFVIYCFCHRCFYFIFQFRVYSMKYCTKLNLPINRILQLCDKYSVYRGVLCISLF